MPHTKIERIIQQLGIEQWISPDVPASASLTDVSSTVFAASAGRAYSVVTLVSASGAGAAGNVFISRGLTAVVGAGQMLQLGVPQKFLGSLGLNGICVSTETAEVAIQKFSVLEGTRVTEIDADA